MQNLFFSGHNLSRKGNNSKQKHKNNTGGKKNQSITFCCGDCRNKHGDEPYWAEGRGRRGRRLPQEKPQKKMRKG